MKNNTPAKPIYKKLYYLLYILFLFLLIEAFSFGLGLFWKSQGKMYQVPVPLVAEPGDQVPTYAEYLTIRDPELGWPPPHSYGREEYERDGSRISPACQKRSEAAPCMSIYGDSFTFGSEVGDDATWGDILSENIDCCVKNYGVPGYGNDQAYLRYVRQQDDNAEIVIFSFMSENILRNISRNFDLLSPISSYGLKPRFVRGDDGSLQLLPLPNLTEEEYLRTIGLKSPPLTLPHESFQPGGAAGVVQLRFPFTLSVIKNLQSPLMRSAHNEEPYTNQFYQKGHPLQGLEITTMIFEQFIEESSRRGSIPLILLLPAQHDIHFYRNRGSLPYQNIIKALQERKIEYLDFGVYLNSLIKNDEKVGSFFMPGGHYTEETNRILADFIQNHFDILKK